MVLDREALQQEGVTPDTPVTIHVEQISLDSALRMSSGVAVASSLFIVEKTSRTSPTEYTRRLSWWTYYVRGFAFGPIRCGDRRR